MYVPTTRRDTVGDPPSSHEELRFQRCSWCSTVVFRTSLLCPVCSSTELRRECGPGAGTVVSTVQVGRKGGRPRTLTVVELRDGVRVRCDVEGVPAGLTPHGTRVKVVGIGVNGIPVFRVAPVRSERW